MKRFFIEFRKGTTRFIVFLVVCYIFVTVGRSVWKNSQTNNEIKILNTEIIEEQSVNEALTNQIAYYKTDTYKELILRERLNLQKDGEKMVVLPKRDSSSTTPLENLTVTASKTSNKPNYELWIDYFKHQ